ncbi:DUF4349 domain-containing protein [Hymenobacter tenuis]
MGIRTRLLAALAGAALTACSGQQENKDGAQAPQEDRNIQVMALEAPPLAPAAPEAPGPPSQESIASGAAQPSAVPAANRKLVYHADVRIRVEDLPRANARMDSLTQALGAFVEQASEVRENGRWNHQMEIRVAPSRFQTLLARLNGLGTLESKTLSTDDVTAEHADVSARLRTKRAVEQRYIALLSQAKKITDILEIEAKIGETREDIESTESRLKTLNDEVAYSTITLSYFQILTLPAPEAPVLSFRSRLAESFYNGWELMTGLVLALVTAWPLLLLGIMLLLVVRMLRRRRAAQAPQQLV